MKRLAACHIATTSLGSALSLKTPPGVTAPQLSESVALQPAVKASRAWRLEAILCSRDMCKGRFHISFRSTEDSESLRLRIGTYPCSFVVLLVHFLGQSTSRPKKEEQF